MHNVEVRDRAMVKEKVFKGTTFDIKNIFKKPQYKPSLSPLIC